MRSDPCAGKKDSRHRVLPVLVACLLAAGCTDSEEDVCCTCLVDNGCTTASRDRCLEVFHVFEGQDSIAVDSQCVGSSGCYTSCAAAGAYFDRGRMVVDYWKRQSLP